MAADSSTATAAVEVEPTRLEFLDAYAPELELLNRRWALQILVVLLQRPARFTEFLRTIPGLSKNVMVERLRELGEAGLVARHVDPGPPVTTTYSLTPDGEALVSERDSSRLLSIDSSGNVEELQRLPENGTGEGGLLGIALSPNYESDGYVYTYYTKRQ